MLRFLIHLIRRLFFFLLLIRFRSSIILRLVSLAVIAMGCLSNLVCDFLLFFDFFLFLNSDLCLFNLVDLHSPL
jgi:hypothetical protein